MIGSMGRIRQRGPKPKLSDSEVLTIEVVGEFLNIDTDQELYTYFQHNYREWVAAWNTVHRTTHARKGYSPKLAEGMFCEIQTTWGMHHTALDGIA